mmetsp:Transcript_78812/g.139264  ORF Transcript_78812/g.139264 Transcript_78812/m.139264 type:complete len:228 (+) Transcript_78812:1321-2004(+)
MLQVTVRVRVDDSPLRVCDIEVLLLAVFVTEPLALRLPNDGLRDTEAVQLNVVDLRPDRVHDEGVTLGRYDSVPVAEALKLADDEWDAEDAEWDTVARREREALGDTLRLVLPGDLELVPVPVQLAVLLGTWLGVVEGVREVAVGVCVVLDCVFVGCVCDTDLEPEVETETLDETVHDKERVRTDNVSLEGVHVGREGVGVADQEAEADGLRDGEALPGDPDSEGDS